jgi:hypothetical protein
VAELTHGTKVEVIADSRPCLETMRTVKVLEGKSAGKTGCLMPEVLKYGVD